MLGPTFSISTAAQLSWSVLVVRGNVLRVAHSAHVAGVAEEMGVQGEAL